MHANLEANLATKQGALEKLAPVGKKVPRFKADDQLLAFLASL
jgi:hypothetical protein